MTYTMYEGRDYDKCDFCSNLYKHITFMGCKACDEHEELAEKRSMDAADYRDEMNNCND